MSINYVKSSKGSNLLVYSGYIFEKDYMKKRKKLIGNVSYTILINSVEGRIQKIVRFLFIKTIIIIHRMLKKLELKNVFVVELTHFGL